MTTITLSSVHELTAAVSVPRIAALEHPFGRTMGAVGDHAGHLAVLRAALQALVDLEEPGGIVHLPFTWPEPPKETHLHPPQPPPIAKYIIRRPWALRRLLSRDIPTPPEEEVQPSRASSKAGMGDGQGQTFGS
jgi:D-proline reductase (dithiol) PrdB